MKPPHTKPFDFDAWMKLAKTNPQDFEQRRRDVTEHVIESAPPERRERMRSLQWKIDMERKRHPNPHNACLHLFGMMWDRVYGENGLLDTLRMVSEPRRVPARVPKSAAVIRLNGKPRR